ncbi:hypothetical protein BAUCODRAFT_492365 [Baudoinia panamericana UAMH 10762]|uniref:Major facilitator superfamily (MFS) profile domain-containing protein n=1 Tax=Baudoinia panamericana (strain UAMH 10762) TaxID=717646 RepID=M2ND76_BAUPA|nr:uncharacterized protein BAUCODRAFT_492365 [Baudoinia panamericana UAMH 10762]EMC96870.1 hypothetical protein BAUCODRAFT_492365 [Baudoinia panamericana UAMH 10762]
MIKRSKKNAARDKNIPNKVWQQILKTAVWTPPRCRYNEAHNTHLSMRLNLLFHLASTITAANMYYTYPILDKVAASFEVSYERASLIPTLLQAGYGTGILFICPLGDSLRLRFLLLGLISFTMVIWVALCLTHSFRAFCALSFIAGFTTVTPQLMLPLASGLAPPARKAAAISIVFSGLMLGVLLPRVLSGVVTEFAPWRTVYWIALGLQCLLFVLLWIFLPDYPSINTNEMPYVRFLWSIVEVVYRQPVLVYACIMVFFSNAAFASYWTTLTALLTSRPYNYSPLQVGLFALIGVAPLLLVPPYSRFVIDRFVPTFSVTLEILYAMAGVLVGAFTATLSIAGVVIQALALASAFKRPASHIARPYMPRFRLRAIA